MKMVSFIALFVGASIAGMSCAWAGIGGCVNSPENPTVVLGMLGGAAAAWPWLKREIPARLRRISRSKELDGQGTTFNGESGT